MAAGIKRARADDAESDDSRSSGSDLEQIAGVGRGGCELASMVEAAADDVDAVLVHLNVKDIIRMVASDSRSASQRRSELATTIFPAIRGDRHMNRSLAEAAIGIPSAACDGSPLRLPHHSSRLVTAFLAGGARYASVAAMRVGDMTDSIIIRRTKRGIFLSPLIFPLPSTPWMLRRLQHYHTAPDESVRWMRRPLMFNVSTRLMGKLVPAKLLRRLVAAEMVAVGGGAGGPGPRQRPLYPQGALLQYVAVPSAGAAMWGGAHYRPSAAGHSSRLHGPPPGGLTRALHGRCIRTCVNLCTFASPRSSSRCNTVLTSKFHAT